MSQSGGTSRLPVIVRCLGFAAACGGLLSFLGWVVSIERLTDWGGTGITIKVNAALAALCAGIGVALLPSGKKAAIGVQVLGSLVSLMGGLTLAEHLIDVNLGIDELLFTEPPGARATAAPGL